MDETVLFPSPNWFQVSGIAATKDNWLIYGGPSKSLCILKPLDTNCEGIIKENLRYQAHVVNRAHSEKIISIDISKEWPKQKFVLSGSADGSVKQWNIENVNNSIKVKSTHSHDIHENEKEGVAGVGYSSDSFAITVGSSGTIAKWELNSNVVNSYKSFLKTYKPNCMSCSHHIPLNVAVGTKQGVVFVLDLSGKGKIIYKMRAQDEEIINISWCPQFDVVIRKSLSKIEKNSTISERLEKIRSDSDESGNLNKSAVAKKLPEDSFDESLVEEVDIFDIYKDHESDEFGHTKYVPKDILVKIKEQKEANEFLAECLELEKQILKRREEEEPSIASLVDALDNTRLENGHSESHENSLKNDETSNLVKDSDLTSAHPHKHLLASIGKYGSVKVWSKTGKLLGSCAVPYMANNKGQKNKMITSNTVLWFKPDVLLISDGKSQLLECNPLKIDCKNKIEWQVLHSLHKRGLYAITSNAPKVQSSDVTKDESKDWKIFTAAQDRNVIIYSYERKQKEAIFTTCGGFVYSIHSCPYDANKIAIGVGDGAIRVWDADTLNIEEGKMGLGTIMSYWQNVQGKVLSLAWHPTKENLLAFGTGESRIGILDTSGKGERSAKTLPPSLRGGVYSLSWGENFDLYACGGGELVLYKTDKPDQEATPIQVAVEGLQWSLSAAVWTPLGLVCGSDAGAVAILDSERKLMAVTFVFNKMIHSIECHPEQTSEDDDSHSPFKNLIAVSSLDRSNRIVVLDYLNTNDGDKLKTWRVLSGHKGAVLQILWNPHKGGILLSSSQDATVRVWDVLQNICMSIFGHHVQSTLGITWSAFPNLSTTIFSGGADCCLRAWDSENHPSDSYCEVKHELVPKKEKKKNKDVKEENHESEPKEVGKDTKLATALDVNAKKKNYKKFLLPSFVRCWITIKSLTKMAEKYLAEPDNGDPEELNNAKDRNDEKERNKCVNGDGEEFNNIDGDEIEDGNSTCDMEFIKLFGTTNEFNGLLNLETQKHLDMNRMESYTMLCVFRGHIDAMIQTAAERDWLCPFIVNLAPCVSYKYWKEVTHKYLAQVERLDAKNEVEKIFENKQYGGPVYRKVALHLSLHDIKSAISTLVESRLFKEAYVLAKARYVDSIAKEVVSSWALDSSNSGNHKLAAICYLALGDLHKAAVALARLTEDEYLILAGKLAKASGQTSFANHIEAKRLEIQKETPEAEFLKPLPSKVDALKKDIDLTCQNED